MHVRKMMLQNYRNYKHVEVNFPSNLNVFVGNNAQGKTNLLESIYLLAMSRSFRTSRDNELIGWESGEANIRMELERYSGVAILEANISNNSRKRFSINGNDLTRIVDLLGHLNVVAFTPDDLQMVKGSPSLRRQFLDIEICQISKVYRQDLAKYNQVLSQRNKLLKDILERKAKASMLEVWDFQLVDLGSRIIAKRSQVVKQLNKWGRLMHEAISSGRERLQIEYQPFFLSKLQSSPDKDIWEDKDSVSGILEEAIKDSREDELRRGVTLVGPQRDDVAFFINEIEVKVFGSQGQQRSTVLSCKLAELEFMKASTGQYPILLLDDVMSELDDHRRSFLMKAALDRVQTFLTTTSFDGVHEEILSQADIFRIEQGRLVDNPNIVSG